MGSLTHKMGYSVAYNVEQSISMVPPCLVLIEALMYEMVGVLWPWTKKAKLDHKKAKIKYFIMIGYYVAAMLCWWQCDVHPQMMSNCLAGSQSMSQVHLSGRPRTETIRRSSQLEHLIG